MRPGEQYLLRRRVFTIIGSAFHIYGPSGAVVAYCKQKAFRLKEDIRLYTDETCGTELLAISARNVIDFSGAYDVRLSDGQIIGTLRRKGLKSMLLRDEWTIEDAKGRTIATLKEESTTLGVLRRYVELVSWFMPQVFMLETTSGTAVAEFRCSRNPFVYKMGITIKASDRELDDLMILASATIIGTIEGTQE